MTGEFPLNQCSAARNLRLSDSGLTLQWLLDALWAHCPEFRESLACGCVVEVSANDISEGKGFVSKVYKTVLLFTDAPTASFTVMMKVPFADVFDKFVSLTASEDGEKKVASSLVDVAEAHNVECKMYEMLRTADCMPLPKVWYTQHMTKESVGVIVMEDLSVENVCLGWTSSLNAEQIMSIVRNLAAFHAFAICMDANETKEWDDVFLKQIFWVDDWAAFVRDTTSNIVEYNEAEFKSLFDRIKPLITEEFCRFALIDRPQQIGLPLLLLHGDCGAHNVFFSKNPDGSASSELNAFIDWQIPFTGNQMADIARVLYGYSDAEVRREVERSVVESYYDSLKEELSKRGQSVEVTLEQIREAYALAAGVMSLQAVIMPGIHELKKNEFSHGVFDAWREKFLLRANLALVDATTLLEKHAPQFLAS